MNVNWSGLGEVFIIALVAGAGLVSLFSLAVASYGRRAEGGTTAKAVAAVCLLACVGIVGYGIYLVIAK